MHYQVPTGYAADTDVVAFLNGELDRVAYIQRSIDEGFVERFFELLSQNADKITDENILPVLEALYDVYLPSEYLKKQEEALFGFFGFELFRGLRWLTFDLISKANDKEALIRRLIGNERYVFITADVIRKLMVQFGDEETREPREREEKWLTEDVYREVKAVWVDVVIRGVTAGWLLNSVLASHVFFALKRADLQKTRGLMAQLLAGEQPAERFARLVGRSGADSTNGPYVQIERKYFEELLDFDALVAAAKRELEREKELPSDLKAVYLSTISGERYYLKDATKGERI